MPRLPAYAAKRLILLPFAGVLSCAELDEPSWSNPGVPVVDESPPKPPAPPAPEPTTPDPPPPPKSATCTVTKGDPNEFCAPGALCPLTDVHIVSCEPPSVGLLKPIKFVVGGPPSLVVPADPGLAILTRSAGSLEVASCEIPSSYVNSETAVAELLDGSRVGVVWDQWTWYTFNAEPMPTLLNLGFNHSDFTGDLVLSNSGALYALGSEILQGVGDPTITMTLAHREGSGEWTFDERTLEDKHAMMLVPDRMDGKPVVIFRHKEGVELERPGMPPLLVKGPIGMHSRFGTLVEDAELGKISYESVHWSQEQELDPYEGDTGTLVDIAPEGVVLTPFDNRQSCPSLKNVPEDLCHLMPPCTGTFEDVDDVQLDRTDSGEVVAAHLVLQYDLVAKPGVYCKGFFDCSCGYVDNTRSNEVGRLSVRVRDDARSFVEKAELAFDGTNRELVMRAFGDEIHIGLSASGRPVTWLVIDVNQL